MVGGGRLQFARTVRPTISRTKTILNLMCPARCHTQTIKSNLFAQKFSFFPMPIRWYNDNYEQLHPSPRPSMKFKMFGRRHLGWGHFLCRLPLTLLSALVVILVLYKSIQSTYPYGNHQLHNKPEQQPLHWTIASAPLRYETGVTDEIKATTMNQLLIRSPDSMTADEDAGRMISRSNEPKDTRETAKEHIPLTTTRRSPVNDYMRRGEVFILILQDEDVLARAHKLASVKNSSGNLYPNSDSRLDVARGTSWHKLVIPAHIRLLIDILKYHKIQYALDVMRTGLPTELLKNPKKYPVIVIDDFIKYDKLNRWARDQLDRYCRSNRIGVITYLIDNRKLNYHQMPQKTTDSTVLGHTRRPTALKAAQQTSSDSADRMKVTTEQYPMSLELLNLNCRNLTSVSCLIDYQLNDKAQLLRILKPKPDFIMKGELNTIMGSSSVMVMTSNHATHEPLTWARLRQPQSATHRLKRRYATSKISTTNQVKFVTMSTQHAHHDQVVGVARIHKRAVLPSPTSATSGYSSDLSSDKGLDGSYDVQNSPNDEYLDEIRNDTDALHEVESGDAFDQQKQSYYPAADFGDKKVIAMLDNGLYDDIRRVIFGISNQHWLNRLLLLDAIEHLSSGEILTPLERYIQIDIDDIFVGATGTRLNESDVFALIDAQDHFASLLEGGFKFNLGFSGKYFKRGSEAEQLGDKQLIANSNKFTWFCHFWSHSKAHLFNTTDALSMELKKNLEFAQDNKLTLIGHREPPIAQHHLDNDHQRPPTYAVAPHHSGVYPIHVQLYEAWRSILNVQITTTEEYPHLRPANQRRGFVHETIKVLPRQTCGLYTHTIFKDKYPGGFEKLVSSIRGGELFETIVHNPVNIYMTHMSNYANDRLGLFTFKTLLEFVQDNTNLRLKYSSSASSKKNDEDDDESRNSQNGQQGGPMFLADYYFSLHPEEREPLWTNPCDDKRHLAIWSGRKLKLCQLAPKLLIVGPQKTGTTALQSFLKLNPSITTSLTSNEDFEEVQFFNDKHYFKGSDWYFERFLYEQEDEWLNVRKPQLDPPLFLDKSATYFDDPKVPRRASSLLPDAYIVILLINPTDRAYSWYQHIKAHGDQTANEFSFDEVIMFQDTSERVTSSPTVKLNDSSSSSSSFRRTLTDRQIAAMKALRNRCLHPGYYSNHLLKWLNYYQSRQIVIIDGEWFKFNPIAVLNRLQLVLRLPQRVDYEKLLVYHRPKGFYCERTNTSWASISSGPRARPSMVGSKDNAQASIKRQASIKCLGNGKGRKYAPMSESVRNYLDDHYLSHNRQLARLLYEIGQPLPSWLDRSINPLPTTVRLL